MDGLSAGTTARIISLCAVLLICGAATSRAQGMDELYERAKLEKTVALYGAGPSDPFKALDRGFSEALPGRHGRLYWRLE